MNWQSGDDGPECYCGSPTIVKELPNGSFVLICPLHGEGSGTYFSLPQVKPDDWRSWSMRRVLVQQDKQ